jgi:hypothetical protein
MRAPLPASAGQEANRRMVRRALLLVGLLCIPVLALMLLQAGVFFACSTETLAEGIAAGRLEWRITRMQCRNGRESFFDVAVGAEDKTLVTALTSRGSPVPVEVIKLDEGLIGVKLDRPRQATGDSIVRIRLRASGSPRERIDLQSDAAPSGPQKP